MTVHRAVAWRVRIWSGRELAVDAIYRADDPAYAIGFALDEDIDITAELSVNVTSVYHASEVALPAELRAAYAIALAEGAPPPRGGRRR